MNTVLCFGDSNTWGYVPGSGERYPFEQRWPGVLQAALNAKGASWRVVENALNGRTTSIDEPFRGSRNGASLIAPAVESQLPLAWLIIMLGSNDVLKYADVSANDAARGVSRLVDLARGASANMGHDLPRIVLVSPPLAERVAVDGWYLPVGAEHKPSEFAPLYQALAKQQGCDFLDAAVLAPPDLRDGVHINEQGHQKLGEALAALVLGASDE